MKHMQAEKDISSLVIHNMFRDLDVKLANTNTEIVIHMVISVACDTRKKNLTRKGLWSQDHPKYINFRLVQFVCKILYLASQKIYHQAKILSACN